MNDRVFTTAELAAYLRVPTAWLNDNYRVLGITSLTVGEARRFLYSDVTAWLEDRREE